jgi:nucleoside-diphosphate-sugar epimerase
VNGNFEPNSGLGRAGAGPPRKLVDVARLKALGWTPKIALRDGLAAAYADFL